MKDYFKIRKEMTAAAELGLDRPMVQFNKIFRRAEYQAALDHYMKAVNLKGKGSAFLAARSAQSFAGVDAKELIKKINALVKKNKLDKIYKA
jgi:hypothetical protein